MFPISQQILQEIQWHPMFSISYDTKFSNNRDAKSSCHIPLSFRLFPKLYFRVGRYFWGRVVSLGNTFDLILYTKGMLLLKSVLRISTEIGQQQNNMKRFYKQAHFQLNPNKKHPLHNYLITLDGKTIKTPYRNVLAVPTPSLAFLITSQFNRQQKYLKTGEMPMLALCRTAVDADIEGHLAEHLRHSIYEYLKTDTLLFVDKIFEKEHQRISKPLVQNFGKRFGMDIHPSSSIDSPQVEINDTFISWIQNLNNWQLIGMQTMTIWMKSTIAAYSTIGSSAPPGEVQSAAYLQQAIQMKYNGQVQQKIMDINQIKLMVSCGEMMYRYSKPTAE